MSGLRQRMNPRRGSETFSIECNGLSYRATVSLYDDGRVGEIFIGSSKADSAADVAVRDAAIATSIALQYGASIEVLRSALTRNADGTPSGALGIALSMIDIPS